jgi:hypothetical protein
MLPFAVAPLLGDEFQMGDTAGIGIGLAYFLPGKMGIAFGDIILQSTAFADVRAAESANKADEKDVPKQNPVTHGMNTMYYED